MELKQSEFEILDWSKANDLLNKKETLFLKTLDFNLAKIYTLKNRYIVAPLNPFGKALLTKNYQELEKWITEENFPTKETINDFYFTNKAIIDSINLHKNTIIEDLEKVVGVKDLYNASVQEIDNIYSLLKKRRQFEKYKLNFVVVVGEKLKLLHQEQKLYWGTVRNKQLLNPTVQLVLINEKANEIDRNQYFDLEYYIFGRGRYLGMNSIIEKFERLWKTENDLAPVIKSL